MFQQLASYLTSFYNPPQEPYELDVATPQAADHLYYSSAELHAKYASYDGWVSKTHTPAKWKARNIVSLESAIYNLRMTHDQRTLLVGTQSSMNVFDCENGIRHVASLNPQNITWTISDMDISDDSKFALSSSLNQYVTLYDLENKKVLTVFNLSKNPEHSNHYQGYYGLRFYSCKMSADKCALIGGSGAQALIQYFDITRNKVLHSIPAHRDDVNTIGFVQRELTSVILSGSDDGLVKVWDIRALGLSGKPVGILYGHRSGITYIDSRNDGIYVCSNSKDQTLKVWDLRNMSTNEKEPQQLNNYDYRYGRPAQAARFQQNPRKSEHSDYSLHTFKGHEVYRTLIRYQLLKTISCHFSPKLTTNSDYIITGSHCGNCYIYSLNDPKADPIVLQDNVEKITGMPILDEVTDDREEDYEFESNASQQRGNTVRDCVWNDTSIIVGDWGELIREYYPI